MIRFHLIDSLPTVLLILKRLFLGSARDQRIVQVNPRGAVSGSAGPADSDHLELLCIIPARAAPEAPSPGRCQPMQVQTLSQLPRQTPAPGPLRIMTVTDSESPVARHAGYYAGGRTGRGVKARFIRPHGLGPGGP